jgi:hypothetical protein
MSCAPSLFLLSNHKDFTGTSLANARGTLLPPYPPELQRGHTQETKNRSSKLALQGRASTLSPSLVSQLSQVKHSPQ